MGHVPGVTQSCGRVAGEWVKCKVTDVDPPRGRISLSLRQTKPDPLKQSFASIIAPPEKGSTEVRTAPNSTSVGS